jgi:methylase of polypeptide subunit release factors
MIFKTKDTEIKIEVMECVYAPTFIAKGFLEKLELYESEKDKRVLEIGSGSGVFALYLALKGYRHILALDNNDESVKCTRLNAELNKVSDCIETMKSETLSGIMDRERFSLIVTNPSNLPQGIWKDAHDRNVVIDKEMMGGPRGNEVMMELVQNIDRIMDKGRIVFIMPTYTDVKQMKAILEKKGFTIRVLSQNVHRFDNWPWDAWKYDLQLLISKLREFEKSEGVKDYVVEKEGKPAFIMEMVEAVRK